MGFCPFLFAMRTQMEIKMKYKYYIYDFDGTISDSYPTFTNAFLQMLSDLGIQDTYESVYSKLKISFANACNSYDLPKMEKTVSQLYREYRLPLMPIYAKPFEDAEKLLSYVVENGGKNYIYTHSGQIAWDLLELWGLKKYFEGGVTSDMKFPFKPAPDALNYLCEKEGLDKELSVMVGDRDIDILAGKNAGIDGILFDPEGYFPNFECTYRVNTLEEIISI